MKYSQRASISDYGVGWLAKCTHEVARLTWAVLLTNPISTPQGRVATAIAASASSSHLTTRFLGRSFSSRCGGSHFLVYHFIAQIGLWRLLCVGHLDYAAAVPTWHRYRVHTRAPPDFHPRQAPARLPRRASLRLMKRNPTQAAVSRPRRRRTSSSAQWRGGSLRQQRKRS